MMVIPAGPISGIAWALLSVAAFVAAIVVALPVHELVDQSFEVHFVEMAVWPIGWGGSAIAGVVVAGRVALGRWLRVTPISLAVAIVGLALASVLNVTYQQWEIGRFGYVLISGPTAWLFSAVLGVTVAGFGVLSAPRAAAAWLYPLLALPAGLAAVIVVLNVPGLADGIDRESWPLAAWIGISATYCLAVLALATRRLLHSTVLPVRPGGDRSDVASREQ